MRASSKRVLNGTLKLAPSAGAIAAVLALVVTAWAQEKRNDEMFKFQTAIALPMKNIVSFDISWVDPVINKYFLADRTNKSIDVIKTDTSPPAFDRLFTSNPPFAGSPAQFPNCTPAGGNDCVG